MADNIKHGRHPTTQSDASVVALTLDVSQLACRETCLPPLLGNLLTQYGIKRGLRELGE